MERGQLARLMLILGFVFIQAVFVGPPRLYQGPLGDRELERVSEHRTPWILSTVFFGFAGLDNPGMAPIARAALSFPTQFLKSLTPQVLFLFTLVAGIWRTATPYTIAQLAGFTLLTVVLAQAGERSPAVVALVFLVFWSVLGAVEGSFHTSVTVLAAEQMAQTGTAPEFFEPLRRW